MNVGGAAEVHPGHRRDHRDARHEHRTAGGGGGRLQRGLLRAPGCTLLALTAQVEHRVVHADGQADQQHDRADRLVDRPDLADRADQADRRGNGGDGEQQGHEGRQQRTKSKDQDDQRDRQRGDLRLLEVVLERLVERLARAAVAELLDPEAGLGLVELRHGRRARGRPCPRCRRRGARTSRARTCRPPTACPRCPRRTGSGRCARSSCPRAGPRRSTRPGGTRDRDWSPRSGSGSGRSRCPSRGSGSRPPCRRGRTRRFHSRRPISVLVPTEPPMKTARITKASHPKIAFFLC